ncbi:MAG: caspase family protein [Salinivirgaceae bacterium]|jgi:hypothetical protein|nr:caspase family protein [Salinivirgaceae bacterium]
MKFFKPLIALTGMLITHTLMAQTISVNLEAFNGNGGNHLFLKNQHPINLIIDVNIKTHDNLLKRYDANPVFTPVLQPNTNVATFIKQEVNRFFAKNNIPVSSQSANTLTILVDQFEVNYLSGGGWTGSVKVDVALKHQNTTIYQQSTMGFKKTKASPKDYQQGANTVVMALNEAIDKVNWEDLMTELKASEKPMEQHNTANSNSPEEKHIPTEEVVYTSDIANSIPAGKRKREHTFAVIIGNENYHNEIPVKFAKNDARVFYQYITKTLGVPEKQAHLFIDATYGKMLGELDWLSNVQKAFGNDATIIFYYAGHGMPDESTKKTFLLPVDGNASQVRTAISTDEIYKSLSEHPSKRVLVFFDACFSGAARDGMLASGRGVRIKPRETEVKKGNLIVFSAVSGDETAHPFDEQNHGLFSYFLMKKLKESKGMVSLGDLYEYIRQNVTRQSIINGKEQNPKVNISSSIKKDWKHLEL